MDPAAFTTATLQRHARGGDVAAVLHAAVAAADPDAAVRRHLQRTGSLLTVGTQRYDLEQFDRVLVLAVGKAAPPMARAALDVTAGQVSAGLVISKADDGGLPPDVGPLPVIAAAHPVPDERSLRAGRRAMELLEGAGEHDLVLALLSGGGSALITWPQDGLALDDIRSLTQALLASGATINEVNALRRRCDRVKGGGLLRAAYPATVAVLVLSDVIGDDLAAIASGPFVPDREPVDTLAVVERYGLRSRLPGHILHLLESLSPPSLPAHAARVHHTIIANVKAAAEGAAAEARARGVEAEVLTTTLGGEARDAGRDLARWLVASADRPRPFCLIAGGETTVTLRGDGLGGRNQELALAAVETLAGHHDLLLVALATDGGDGPTGAAGAVVSGETLSRGQALGLDPQAFLLRNDAYHYFEPLGDLLKPGPTETNVNDLALLFAF